MDELIMIFLFYLKMPIYLESIEQLDNIFQPRYSINFDNYTGTIESINWTLENEDGYNINVHMKDNSNMQFLLNNDNILLYHDTLSAEPIEITSLSVADEIDDIIFSQPEIPIVIEEDELIITV